MQSSHGSLWIPMGLVAAHHHSMHGKNLRGHSGHISGPGSQACHECSPEMGGIHLNMGIDGSFPDLGFDFQWWRYMESNDSLESHQKLLPAIYLFIGCQRRQPPIPVSAEGVPTWLRGLQFQPVSASIHQICLPKEGLGKHHLIPYDFTLACAWCVPPYRSAVCLSILVVKVSYQIRRRIWEYSSEAIPIGMCPRCYGQIGSDRSWGRILEGNFRIVLFGIVTVSDTIL